MVVDGDYRVQLWSAGAERLTGLRAFEAEGLPLFELDLGLPGDGVTTALRRVVRQGESAGPLDVALTDRFGRPQRRRLVASPLRTTDGAVGGAVVTLADVPV